MTSSAKKTEPTTFGQFLAAERKRLGLSQKDLAALVKKEDGTTISGQYINDLERDRRNPPADHVLRQMAAALQLSYDRLAAVAGQIPEDVRERYMSLPPERREAAVAAFRKVLERH